MTVRFRERTMKYVRCIVYYFYLLNAACNIFGSELYNHSTAESTCQAFGGLLSSEIFMENGYITIDSLDSVDINLVEGESMWISGYVEYSNVISWHGCYKEKPGASIIKKIYWNNYLTDCLNFCKSYQVDPYVGVRKDRCYCIRSNDFSNSLEAIRNKECHSLQPYNIKFNYNLSDEIGVYRFLNLKIDPTQNQQQCLYVNTENNPLKFLTSSCYINMDEVSSFICLNGARKNINTTCGDLYKTNVKRPGFCIKNESINWIEADLRCRDLSGKLVDDTIFQIVRTSDILNSNYWTGMFRPFEVKTEAATVCLAGTKIDNKLVLDPSDCSQKKKYMCELSTVSTQSYTKEEFPRVTSSTENKKKSHAWIYITVTVSLIAIVTTVTCIAVSKIKRKSHHKKLHENTSASLGNDFDKGTSANTASDEYMEPTLRDETEKIKPKKPTRKTLRKQNFNTTYENFKLKKNTSDLQESSDRKASEEYDRVNLKSRKVSLLNKNNSDESNVYNHTTEKDCENYDTIKSTKSCQPFDNVTYSTLQRKCDNGMEIDDKNLNVEIHEKLLQNDTNETNDNDNNVYDAMGEIKTTEIKT